MNRYLVRGGLEQRAENCWRSIHLTDVTVEGYTREDAIAKAKKQMEQHPLINDYNRDFTRAFALVITEV